MSSKVYKVYTYDHDSQGGIDNYYGWSNSKAIINAFMQQRNPKKYIVDKEIIPGNIEIEKYDCLAEFMIDTLRLKSSNDGQKYTIFMTKEEMMYIENSIRELQSSYYNFNNDPDSSSLMQMIFNLDEEYLQCLEFIGYRPLENSYLFDEINEAYDYQLIHPSSIDDVDVDRYSLPGERNISDKSKLLMYSLENVIRILGDKLI